jgi:hypothetical protein
MGVVIPFLLAEGISWMIFFNNDEMVLSLFLILL